jgi:hypothetical protein
METQITSPVYWKTSLQDVEETLMLVKRGTVTLVTKSAGHRPIYKVEYGKSNLPKSKANVSSALGAGDITCYADKTGEDYVPTVYLAGCIHGGEFEGTMALLNLIKMIETGTDYAGNTDKTLLDLAERVHLIIMPMCNPDGRSHIPFDDFVGKSFEDLRYYNQGTWLDGTLCGWPQCKKVHPIKPYVDYLGGYYNDDGVNMMHDDFFGKMSNEVRAVLDVCLEEAPDFSILLHGGTNTVAAILLPAYSSGIARTTVKEVSETVGEKCAAEDIKFTVTKTIEGKENNPVPPSFNLISAMHHCCGEPCVTFESNQGLSYGKVIYTHEQIYRSHMILFESTFERMLAKFAK